MEQSIPAGNPTAGSQDRIPERRAAEGEPAEHAADLEMPRKELPVPRKEPSKRNRGSSAQCEQSQEQSLSPPEGEIPRSTGSCMGHSGGSCLRREESLALHEVCSGPT